MDPDTRSRYDEFAAAALAGLLANSSASIEALSGSADALAALAWDLGEAMVRERKRRMGHMLSSDGG